MVDVDVEYMFGQFNEFFGFVEQMQVVDIVGIVLFVYLIEQIQEVVQCLCDDVVMEVVDCDDNQCLVLVVQDGFYFVLKVIE